MTQSHFSTNQPMPTETRRKVGLSEELIPSDVLHWRPKVQVPSRCRRPKDTAEEWAVVPVATGRSGRLCCAVCSLGQLGVFPTRDGSRWPCTESPAASKATLVRAQNAKETSGCWLMFGEFLLQIAAIHLRTQPACERACR